MRKEVDFLGEKEIPDHALYGIQAVRATENFPDNTRFSVEWYCAVGSVKKACYLTYQQYARAVNQKYPAVDLPLPIISQPIIAALTDAASEIEKGMHFDHFITPAIQGGAGTSINLNINEIIANRALQLTGHQPGEYQYIHPIEHANIFQSTNDVIPSSLHVALMRLLVQLSHAINNLRSSVELHERNAFGHLRMGYTEMQEAVPTTYGRLFSTYNDALSRDWWRTSKCSERIKTVNLGGSAIGTGITVPAMFIREVTATLQHVTGLPIARAENLSDSTSNLDALVEIHATLKAHAVNLEKMVSDIRLLSSDIMANRQMHIPQLQMGSSIMPGKVNPVIPEFVVSAAHKVYCNDQLIAGLSALGCLELNAYIPVIGHALIESMKLLIACDDTLKSKLFEGLSFDGSQAFETLMKSPSITTALIPFIGYNKAAEMAAEMKKNGIDLFEANRNLAIMDEVRLKAAVSPEYILKEGFSLKDILDEHGQGQRT